MTDKNTKQNEWLDKYIAGERLQYRFKDGTAFYKDWIDFGNPRTCNYASMDLLQPGCAPEPVEWRVKPVEPKRGWLNIYKERDEVEKEYFYKAGGVLFDTYEKALACNSAGSRQVRFAIVEVIEGQGITI